MKKLALIVVLLLVAVVAFYVTQSDPGTSTPGTDASSTAGTSENGRTSRAMNQGGGTSGTRDGELTADGAPEGDDMEQPDRPATELYRNADEALKAVKEGAVKYDDIVLEQFTMLGPDCGWCDEFYRHVRDLSLAGDIPADQKSYYAELLAVSGRVDNVQALVANIENAPSEEAAETFTSALEMTIGKDDVVKYLGSKLDTAGAGLKESLVAAITNQSSSLAVDTLYKFTTQSGNADGFYSDGTGLGEVVPDEEAFPLLTEIVQKRDDYSHLGAKALLNAGDEGFKTLVDVLKSSNDPEKDRALLKDAIDHVNMTDDALRIARENVNSSNSILKEFSQKVVEQYESEQTETEAEGLEVGEETEQQ